MKTRTLLFSLFLTSFLSKAQETKLISKKGVDFFEEYTVLVEDKKIKHGSYFKLTKSPLEEYALDELGTFNRGHKDGFWQYFYRVSNHLKEQGFYKLGERDSLWVSFYPQERFKKLAQAKTDEGVNLQISGANPKPLKAGIYREGKPTGDWFYFNTYGDTIRKYNYDKKIITHLNGTDSENYNAGFIDGDQLINGYLYEQFNFHQLMKELSNKLALETGRLTYKVKINDDGSIAEIICLDYGIQNKKIQARALETIESLNGRMYPKRESNINVATEFKIAFELEANFETRYFNATKYTSARRQMSFKLKINTEL